MKHSRMPYSKDISEVQWAFYKSTMDYLIPAWCIKEKGKLNKKDTPRFAHITRTKRNRKHTDTCWRKMGCLPGHTQAETLEYPWIFTWGAVGIPKLELLPLLLLLTSRPPRSSNTSSTQNLTELLVAGLVNMAMKSHHVLL